MCKLKKVITFAIVLLLIFTISGCGQSKGAANDDFAFPEVNFTLSDMEVGVGEPILFDAFVSVEGEPIADADRVEFEIWHESQEDGERENILIEHAGEGHYQLEKAFEQAGTYYVYYHIDTMGLHLMEKFEFTIK